MANEGVEIIYHHTETKAQLITEVISVGKFIYHAGQSLKIIGINDVLDVNVS